MPRARHGSLAAYLAIVINAATYLFVFHAHAAGFVLRRSGSWWVEFGNCPPCVDGHDRVGALTCVWLLVGLAALFVRRSEGLLVARLTSLFVIFTGWAPILAAWRIMGSDGLAYPAARPAFVWAAILTALGLAGLAALLVPNARRILAGTPAA